MLDSDVLQNTLNTFKEDFSTTSFEDQLNGAIAALNNQLNSSNTQNNLSLDLSNIDRYIDTVMKQLNADSSQSPVQRGSKDSDVLIATGIDNKLYGLAGDDLLDGGRGDDLLNGGTGRDVLLGDRGNDILIDSDGGDFMIGGRGTDNFRISDWELPKQASTILDFKVGIDKITIGRVGATFDNLELRQSSLGTSVYDQNREIAFLAGVEADSLSADNFVVAASTSAEELQAGLDQALAESGGVPGATQANITEDGFTWKGATGLANLETQDAMQPDDIFSIASTTKTFTAATVLKIVEADQLSLDDTLGQYLPEIAQNYPGGENFTVRQLLNGRSGIPSFDTTEAFGTELASATSLSDLQQFSDSLKTRELIELSYGVPLFTDGAGGRASEQWAYTNTSDIIAGLIVEEVTGKNFAQVMREEVIDPLGLENTSYGGEEPIKGDLARSYVDLQSPDDGQLINFEQPNLDGIPEDITAFDVPAISAFGAAGALFSNAEDTARFTQALLSGELLNEQSLKELTDLKDTGLEVPGFSRYGLGVFGFEAEGAAKPDLILAGDSYGYQSRTIYSQETGASQTVLLNRQFRLEGIANPPADEAVDEVASETLDPDNGETGSGLMTEPVTFLPPSAVV